MQYTNSFHNLKQILWLTGDHHAAVAALAAGQVAEQSKNVLTMSQEAVLDFRDKEQGRCTP